MLFNKLQYYTFLLLYSIPRFCLFYFNAFKNFPTTDFYVFWKFYNFFLFCKVYLFLSNQNYFFFNSYSHYYSFFLCSFLAKVCFLVLFCFNYSRVKRQVQRRVKSASVNETTSRVRCNVCYAPRLKHKYATQTKNADLQQTFAKQDKTRQIKATFCKTIS